MRCVWVIPYRPSGAPTISRNAYRLLPPPATTAMALLGQENCDGPGYGRDGLGPGGGGRRGPRAAGGRGVGRVAARARRWASMASSLAWM